VLNAATDVLSPLPTYELLTYGLFDHDLEVGPLLSPDTIRMVWSDPSLLRLGLSFSLPMMLILLCHELGHYLCCRHYGIAATPPYFLPAPLAIGTFGAFIRIRSPIRSRRELFDVGIAGPIAGFVALVPFLVYGICQSEPTRIEVAGPSGPAMTLQLPGESLLSALVTRVVHGPLPEGVVLNPHPFVLAAWVGLFATSLNLVPLSQLDGGHILYAVIGKWQWLLAVPLWLLLIAAGFLFPGWWLWALITVLIGLRHPPVGDDRERLGRGRIALAVCGLLILALCFMPVPIRLLPIRLLGVAP
jgi:membrane-associated protease RseP (regulator of RpoE activity)